MNSIEAKHKKRSAWIRVFLAKDNVRHRDIARKLGIDPSVLSAFLNDAKPFPPDLFESILEILEVKHEVAERVCASCGLEWDL